MSHLRRLEMCQIVRTETDDDVPFVYPVPLFQRAPGLYRPTVNVAENTPGQSPAKVVQTEIKESQRTILATMYFDSNCNRCHCDLPQVEDTRHVLLTCPASRLQRMQLHRQLKAVMPSALPIW